MTAPPSPKITSTPASAPGPAAHVRSIRFRALVRASGGPRYTFAIAVDAIGTGLLQPFMLLYGIDVLRLPSLTAGLAMVVRVIGTALLLPAPAGSTGTVWLFAAAALFLGIGNQAFPVAHAALVATVSGGRERDAALAVGRSVRNAGLGLGALIATAALTGAPPPSAFWRLTPDWATCCRPPSPGPPGSALAPNPPPPCPAARTRAHAPLPSPGCACSSPRTSSTCSASAFLRSRSRLCW